MAAVCLRVPTTVGQLHTAIPSEGLSSLIRPPSADGGAGERKERGWGEERGGEGGGERRGGGHFG